MARRAQIVVRIEGGRIVPASFWDRDILQGMAEGTLLSVSKYRPKSDRAVRFLHAIINKAAANAWDDKWTPETIKATIKARYGWVEGARIEVDGTAVTQFRSIADLDAEELERFIQQTLDLIATEVCPGIDIVALRKEADDDIQPTR